MSAFNTRRVPDDPNNSHLSYNNHIGPNDVFVEILNRDSTGQRDKSVFLNYVAAVALVAVAVERGASVPNDDVALKSLFCAEVARLADAASSLDDVVAALCCAIAKHGHSEIGQQVITRLLPELGSIVRSTQARG